MRPTAPDTVASVIVSRYRTPVMAPAFWQHLTVRTRQLVALNIIAVIGGGLALDARFGWPGQIAAIFWTLCVFIWLYRLGTTTERRLLLLCTAISAAGEAVLSLVWGLYDYQFRNVPLFVPPGHALLMTLGLLSAPLLNRPAVAAISFAAATWGVYACWAGFDRFGAALFGVYAFCMIFGRARALYAVMFMLALTMELYGTALGNWAWAAETRWLGLSQSNPPFSAGAFYCLLDLLVLAALAALPRPVAAASSAQ